MARTIADAFLFDSTWGDGGPTPKGPAFDFPPQHPLDWAQLNKILRDNLDGELSIIVDAKGNLRLR
ncbi:hypothetical protein [Streptomyces novaecaesareae]|uniref:hypothetical protein n=1 Tax=Streptomyces novaecaesareae TaxID=68244 RepID=UPI0004AB40C9|nr:hypothetical protein [Streptomyces novaecaesareae]